MSLLQKDKKLLSLICCRSSGASKSKDKTLSSLERYQQVNLLIFILINTITIIISSFQFFTKEKASPKGCRLLGNGHAEDLNLEGNAALQVLLLVSAM